MKTLPKDIIEALVETARAYQGLGDFESTGENQPALAGMVLVMPKVEAVLRKYSPEIWRTCTKLPQSQNGVPCEILNRFSEAVRYNNGKLGFWHIEELVCGVFRLKPEQLPTTSRKTRLVIARQTAWYFSRKTLPLTFEKIGGFYNRDHATALHGCKQIALLLETKNGEWTPLINQVKAVLEAANFLTKT